MTSHFDGRTAVRRHARSHPEYPLEQLARSRSTRFQLGFARMTVHLLPDLKEAAVEPCEHGLVILAASEIPLARAGEVIRRIHADDVHMDEPKPRLLYGDSVEEPIMWVRVVVPGEVAERVVRDLIMRDAEIVDVDWMAATPTVRAKAPLRELLGYPAALAEVCGTAALRMWLSHYAPAPPDPDAAA